MSLTLARYIIDKKKGASSKQTKKKAQKANGFWSLNISLSSQTSESNPSQQHNMASHFTSQNTEQKN